VVGPEPRISDKALWAFMVWQDWQASVKLRPLALEQVVWSTTHRFAGTLDFLAEIILAGHAVPVPSSATSRPARRSTTRRGYR
jgi:hypothetical protein